MASKRGCNIGSRLLHLGQKRKIGYVILVFLVVKSHGMLRQFLLLEDPRALAKFRKKHTWKRKLQFDIAIPDEEKLDNAYRTEEALTMLRNVFGCVSDRSTEAMRTQKVKFGAPLSTALKNGYLPIPMVKFLLSIPGGVFSPEAVAVVVVRYLVYDGAQLPTELHEHGGTVEKASRIMQLLIDNFGVARVFGQHNIEYFAEVTHIEIHVRETFKYQYTIAEDKYVDMALSRLRSGRETDGSRSDGEDMRDGGGDDDRGHHDDGEGESNLLVTSTVSVPEVSLVPSPEVSKRPKSVENSLNEAHNNTLPKPSLSRYNSVKRKQLERLRQRSDWFLGPSMVSSPSINISNPVIHIAKPAPSPPSHETIKPKLSGNSVTRSSSDGAVLEGFSDQDSVCSERSSRSESPASEPIRTNNAAMCVHKDIVHASTLDDIHMEYDQEEEKENIIGLTDDELTESEICYFMIEHKYGEPKS
ncbi:hypothetical protein MAR_018909 [Mya arenaria]|uniref:Uncharacterized protein n=1 Tax=Mya arenaria TaxID=6604 RepID=A0ABY7EP28_MYAAR|nr:hypothetical protein MAR_018909 [Mya arenaria]